MPFAAMILPALMLAAATEEPPVVVRAYPWAPFISPMGEPFRSRTREESPIGRWFAQADRNRDGYLVAPEAAADADRFFARLDDNRDGQIDPVEVKAYEWVIAPEIQVSENWRRPRGVAAPKSPAPTGNLLDEDPVRPKGDQHDGYLPDGLQGAARYGLLNIPQPVASADADFNRSISLAEFRRAAATRFGLLDAGGAGRITLRQLEGRLPTRPEGKRRRDSKKLKDTRVGLPFPAQ